MPTYLVVYDVSDDRRRLMLAQALERFGLRRIQRSAFVGSLLESLARDLARLCESIVDPRTDVVHIVPVDRRDWARAVVVGRPRWSAGAPRYAVLEA